MKNGALSPPDADPAAGIYIRSMILSGQGGTQSPSLNLEPRLVDRRDEVVALTRAIDRAQRGEGSCTIVSGEAGIGKTRLVEELRRDAGSRGFLVLSSNSVYESLSPYMPFFEALKSGGFESLFAEEPPRVESVMLVTNNGLMLSVVTRKESNLDPDIFASMLTTVGNFVKDTLSLILGKEQGGMLNTLGYKDYRIIIEGGEAANLVLVLTGKENEHLLSDARELLAKVERRFGTVISQWDGDEGKVDGIGSVLEPLITSGKYDGVGSVREDPRSRRDMLFDNVAMGLERISQGKPVVLCIEDLQWADPSTLALFHYVASHTRRSPIAMLGTYRPEDIVHPDHPLLRALELMEREDLSTTVRLDRLPEAAIKDFIAEMLGPVEISSTFVERTYRETEGNPLFMMQLLGLLFEEGAIAPQGSALVVGDAVGKIDIPSKVYTVIARRLDRLEVGHRRILEHASVIGVSFSPTTLASALGMGREPVLEQLREIETKYLLIRSNGGDFRFDHTKIKEVLYDRIPRDLRREYHSKVAAALEYMNRDDLDRVVEDLAFHYMNGTDECRALGYLLRAAEKAKRMYSNDEAIRFFRQALALVQDVQQRTSLLEEMGQLYVFLGRYQDSLRAYNDAIAATSDRRKKATLHARVGGTYAHMGEYDMGLEACKGALELLGDEDCVEKGIVHGTMGILYEKKRDYRQAIQHLSLVSRYKRDGEGSRRAS